MNTRAIAEQEAAHLRAQEAMPALRIGINPDPSLVAVESWFWVDPASYANAPLSVSGRVSVPWEESWDETETHQVACGDDEAPDCERTVSTTYTVVVPHTDVIIATDAFTPSGYVWNFGDGRPGSEQAYPVANGLGTPYTNATSPSTVAWTYQFDSRDHADGFPVALWGTWQVTYAVRATSDYGPGNYVLSSSLEPRIEPYTANLVVRQVQALLVAVPLSGRGAP
jgi:hypothetical protein